MKGPLRRIRFRRAPSGPAPEETQATVVAPAVEPGTPEPLPAGLTVQDVAPAGASFRDRGKLRRRLRYLRRVRELAFRDLGGLVFDLHRFGRRNDEVVLGKLAALDAVDRELRAIERVLDERRDIIELREPGIAACPRCGALHGTEDRFCPSCGTQFSGPLAIGDMGAPQTAAHSEAAPTADQAGASPVAGALTGDQVEAPPAPPEAATPEAPAPEGAVPASDAPPTDGADQPTVALPAVDEQTPADRPGS